MNNTHQQKPEEITPKEYQTVRKLVYEQSGIDLGDHKIQLVRARLGKLVRVGGFGSFKEYYEHVLKDNSGNELCSLLDAISTNTTHLFRENKHFELLAQLIDEWVADSAWRAKNKTLRIWSAACSSGEEPYSIAMVAHDRLSKSSGIGVKILATDISTKMLEKGRRGVFSTNSINAVPAAYKRRYLSQSGDKNANTVQATTEIRKLITFSRFNLMSPAFPFKNAFNVIFCRNVMIYFDKPTQETLVNKFAQHIQPGGYLLIGHSESLNGLTHPYNYNEPTVYQR